MAINLRLDSETEHHATELGRTHEWLGALDWILSLDEGLYPLCIQLGREERVTDTKTLAEQLELAYQITPPTDEHANNIIDRLLDLLGVGHQGETVTIE